MPAELLAGCCATGRQLAEHWLQACEDLVDRFIARR